MSSVNEFCEIARLKEFLEKHLRKRVLDYSMRSFTKLGDHYGSLIKGLTVEVADHENVSHALGALSCDFAPKLHAFILEN